MLLNRAAFDRHTQAFERLIAAFDRHERRFEQSREIVAHRRELDWRNDPVARRSGRETDELLQAMKARGEKEARRTEEIVAESHAAHEESKQFRRELRERLGEAPPPAQAA